MSVQGRTSSDTPSGTPSSKRRSSGSLPVSIAFVAAMLVCTLVCGWFYLRVFRPVRYVELVRPSDNYDPSHMQEAISPERVREQLDTILSFGSRTLGQPGMYKTAEYIREAYEAAGLEIYEHELQTASFETAYREIYEVTGDDSGYGRELADVEVYPFRPNFLQPVVTPDTGLVGELVLLDPQTLRTRKQFDNCIGLLDSREGMVDETYAYAWTRYAKLGVKALIISHSDGLEAAPWEIIGARFSGLVRDLPVNYVRLAATKGIFEHVGKTVRLRVRADFKQVRDPTIYGVLRAGNPAGEAIFVTAGYDAKCLVPDLALSPIQASWVALQLQLAKGLAPYRDQLQRDVIFAAYGSTMMSEAGLNALIRVLGENKKTTESNRLVAAMGIEAKGNEEGVRQRWVQEEVEGNNDSLALVGRILEMFEEPGFLTSIEATSSALDQLSGHERGFFKEQFRYVMNTLVLEASEPMLQAKIAFERLGGENTKTPEFSAYLEAKGTYDRVSSAAGYQAVGLLDARPEQTDSLQVRQRCRQRFDELAAFHRTTARRLEQEKRLVELIDPYDDIAAFDIRLLPSLSPAERREVLTLDASNRYKETATLTIANVAVSARQRLGLDDSVAMMAPTEEQVRLLGSNTDLWSFWSDNMWANYGYASYAFTHVYRTEAVRHLGDPTNTEAARDLESVEKSMAVVGETVVSLAHGNGKLRPTKIAQYRNRDWGGEVLVSNVGQSIVPNYPLKGALISARPFEEKAMMAMPGIYTQPIIYSDPYGQYMRKRCASDFVGGSRWRFNVKQGHSPVAVGFGDDGLIAFMKDEGEDGQRLFKSVGVPQPQPNEVSYVTIVTFRAAPVSVVDLTNPQSMKDYTGFQVFDSEGLIGFSKGCAFWDKGIRMMYLKPDERFYAAFQSGAPDNELAKMIRAFMLGIDEHEGYESSKVIDGPGYLVADNPFLLDVPHQMGQSMVWVNGKRLELQNSYDMADEQTNEYHRKAIAHLEQSNEPGLTHNVAARLARDAVTYATLTHPVLRESVFEAVMGVLWYLALLVPFVFFFEKLVFCYPDVRKQLAAQAVIFLTVFLLLRLLHPAFQMVRSSLMILLGFIIILISGGITLLFSGKFQENLEELRKKQGKVAAAEVNKMGVLMSAFMLGLNNMHRRKMRTGLTCATLTLLTFVMICFTSVQNKVMEEDVAIGKAPYQGFMVERERMQRLKENEYFALCGKYGDRYEVSHRRMLIGRQGMSSEQKNPELDAQYEADGVVRRCELETALLMNHNEPLRHRIPLLDDSRWFTEEEDEEGAGVCPVIIPDRLADNLGISIEDANQERAVMTINGLQFRVIGIFDSRAFAELRDIDGRDLLPFDVERMSDIVTVDNAITAQEDDPRIDPATMVITPVRSVFKNVTNSDEIIASACIAMPGVGYKEARTEIEGYLEQTGQRVFYGLDGVAYRGRRVRGTTMAGLIDLLIPLLIAGLTVLNTMKGSVYERRDEIFVYNAVGIAPRYVFMMFIAEAFVYAVVGSVLGYLASQGTGRILTILDLTGGLNMTFASLATIYASLTIAAAVFLSTYFPAKSAMEIAAPAEESGWSLPEPEGDELEFDLPFNFSTHGRIAVLAFFDRYLRDNGEGSAGRFFAAVPEVAVAADEEEGGGYVPEIRTTIWLKPFDLAVCQRMTIVMPPDPETGQYKARIHLERMSGTREAWMRLNKGFVSLIRRHFLHWRAVTDEEREEMFEEARNTLTATYGKPVTTGSVT